METWRRRPGEPRQSVFISYAHEDQRWVEEFSTHLKPWVKDRRVSLWDDRNITPGEAWKTEIERALDDAAISVVIVTPNALASDFIVDAELPRILDRASRGTTRLVWIAAEPSGVEATPLRGLYQAVNDPARPLSTLSKPERQRVLTEIAETIATSTITAAIRWDSSRFGRVAPESPRLFIVTTQVFARCAERRCTPMLPAHVPDGLRVCTIHGWAESVLLAGSLGDP